MMKCTSAQAAKLLRRTEEQLSILVDREGDLAVFSAFANDDIEAIRPEHDYSEYQRQIAEMEQKVRKIKHAINRFNVNTELPGMPGMTIDQALICLPQLSRKKI